MAADKVEATPANTPAVTSPEAPATAAAAATEKPSDPPAAASAAAIDKTGGGQEEAAAAAAAVAGGGEKEEEEEEEEMAVFITVHPPHVPTTTGAAAAPPLVLEPLAGMELVMQVRQLLAEIPQTCLYSAFRLVAVTPKAGTGGGGGDNDKEEGGGGGGGDDDVDDDVWQGPGDVMNDFVELRSIPAVVARPHKVEVRGGSPVVCCV